MVERQLPKLDTRVRFPSPADFLVQPSLSARTAPAENTEPVPAYPGNHRFGSRTPGNSPRHTLVTSASPPPTLPHPRRLFPRLLRFWVLCRSDHRNPDRYRRACASLLSTLPV